MINVKYKTQKRHISGVFYDMHAERYTLRTLMVENWESVNSKVERIKELMKVF